MRVDELSFKGISHCVQLAALQCSKGTCALGQEGLDLNMSSVFLGILNLLTLPNCGTKCKDSAGCDDDGKSHLGHSSLSGNGGS